MNDDWALIARGKPDLVGFEYLAVLHAQGAVTGDWPHGVVDEELAAQLPPVISLTEVQEQENADMLGGGYRSPGAPKIFAELVKLGAIRPVTAEQFRVIERVVAESRSQMKTNDQSAWFEVIPGVLSTLYPKMV